MNEQFLNDVIGGLRTTPKELYSKYFYDQAGDALFQQIMQSPEYYLTKFEFEIFEQRSGAIASLLRKRISQFDLLELGAGDASKSSFLLKALIEQEANFRYMPIDISSSMIDYLEDTLPDQIPGLEVHGLQGEYFPMLAHVKQISKRPKVVLFLGSNIGNFERDEALDFCKGLHATLNPGDLLLMGFDLKKNPHTIFHAYNDHTGYTKAFNLNLLTRINNELDADFDLTNFEHYNSYDPFSGACRSYLVSLKAQQVRIAGEYFDFLENEIIKMEISQKYSVEEIREMGNQTNFDVVETFFDSKQWFLDILWQVI